MCAIEINPDGLRFEVDQLAFRAPGAWRVEEPPASNVLLYVVDNDRNRRLTVSALRRTTPTMLDERPSVARELIEMFAETEREVTKGMANIKLFPLHDANGIVIGGMVVVHPSAGRVVITRLLVTSEWAFNFYWEVERLASLPNLGELLREFQEIVGTIEVAP